MKKNRFVDNGNGTVTDSRTGLIWAKDGNGAGCNNGNPLTWKQAVAYCKKLKFAGKKDWRLPTIEELLSIVDYREGNPVIDKIFLNTKSDWYWTSTEYVPSSSVVWVVVFSGGDVDGNDKAGSGYVRAVRGGK